MSEETGNNQEKRNPDGTFKPGVSGNPSGRPKDADITEAVRMALAKRVDHTDPDSPTKKTKLVEKILENAIDNGDTRTMKMIWEQIDGKPTQKQEITGKDGGPVTFVTPSEIAEKNNLGSSQDTKDSS